MLAVATVSMSWTGASRCIMTLRGLPRLLSCMRSSLSLVVCNADAAALFFKSYAIPPFHLTSEPAHLLFWLDARLDASIAPNLAQLRKPISREPIFEPWTSPALSTTSPRTSTASIKKPRDVKMTSKISELNFSGWEKSLTYLAPRGAAAKWLSGREKVES